MIYRWDLNDKKVQVEVAMSSNDIGGQSSFSH